MPNTSTDPRVIIPKGFYTSDMQLVPLECVTVLEDAATSLGVLEMFIEGNSEERMEIEQRIGCAHILRLILEDVREHALLKVAAVSEARIRDLVEKELAKGAGHE